MKDSDIYIGVGDILVIFTCVVVVPYSIWLSIPLNLLGGYYFYKGGFMDD